MEELVGGKGAQVLPYAVRDYFDHQGEKIEIISSEILVEIENRDGDIATLRRAIRDNNRDSKLVEIVHAAVLTEALSFENTTPTYLHDPGSAQKGEGFFYFLERFLKIDLPKVATTNGPEVKLYIQTIFAAHAVEQKRGWTDYIANIPLYGIRDARARVAEYILGLGVFETISLRNRLNAEAVTIDHNWRRILDELQREAATLGFVLAHVPPQPKATFNPEQVRLFRTIESGTIFLADYIAKLLTEHQELRRKSESSTDSNNLNHLKELEATEQEIQSLSVMHERATSNLSLQRASLAEYEELLREAKNDLDRNKAAQKLQELGASQAIELATGICPTCHQSVEDSLLGETLTGPQMDLQTNIGYLESQSRMLQRQISGVTEGIKESSATIAGLAAQLASKRDHMIALRNDLGSSASQSKANLRRQVKIEIEVERLQKLESDAVHQSSVLKSISDRLAANQLARRNLPSKQYTEADEQKISIFEKNFRANAGSFGYESVSNISEIQINRDSLVPGLAQIELREILSKQSKTDIKADSSASDFVRLIWSYLLALYQTSANKYSPGNHLGLILFDEPGQHSMRWESQRELLLRLAAETGLQSIVAASFDESESVFNDVTEGVEHRLIDWEGKLIQPL
ncbi:hypothetical protein NB722_002878 [Xanthomonas sacchari]|uniref:hypothetical protein n=1 Tax=Xanthomonas sacchari TaxID=56458 RepID=UPI00224FD9BA|nr:hypothetical protein [Xanthomonas sacchari]MCW0388339.1 hypothetical protein [Xanthomonas sacchari]